VTTTPPPWLGKTGREYWARFEAYLRDDRQADMLALLCQEFESYHAALANIRNNGQTITSDGGRIFINPCCALMNEAGKQIQRLSKALKLPPYDGAAQADTPTEWGGLIAGGE
jgi:P27 family predicted phage terminase small subunit